jgi:predicted RND superfamily exporter protein
VALPLGVAAITVVWTIGAYAWTGHALNAITSLLPAVLLVVALAASVHLYEAWRSGHGGGDPVDAVLRAVRAIAVPATLCAVTTAQGFLSLAVSEVPAVRQFGLFAALGVAVAFLVGMTAMPAAMTWLAPPPARGERHRWTLGLLDATSHLATARPGAVLGAFGAVTALAAAGIPLVRANTDLVGFLRAGAPLRRDTTFVDGALTGTVPLDFVLRRRDGRPLDSLDAVRRLAVLEDAIRARPHVTTVTSLAALVRQVHRAETDGRTLALPGDPASLGEALDLLDTSGHALVRRFAARDFRALRVSVRLRAVGSAESAPLIAGILADAARLLGPDYVLTPTGALYHVVHDSTRLVGEQVASFGSAIVLVVLAIGLLFRSLAFTVVALVPNVMPIVWTGGLMGFAGIELSTGTAMIASAVLGLVVDDTIHYLAHYRRAYAGGAVAAIRATTRAVGAPVTVASVSLVLGFWVGAFGSFKPTIYFSLLTGLTMITGVLCDLLVLPASLVVLDRLDRGRRARATPSPSSARPASGGSPAAAAGAASRERRPG